MRSAAAIERHARLLDVHSDADHNRSVFTLVGVEEELVAALVDAVRVACERIDLRSHDGAHPRIGAADVVPVVPVVPEDLERARACALELARRHRRRARAAGVPLRGVGARPRSCVLSPRRRSTSCSGDSMRVSVAPDFGPARLDERAGGVIVGARRPLIAFNVNLRGASVETAREIAAVVRESGGGFPGVRALGLDLPRAGVVQVSMNVEDWEAAALHEIVARIEARGRGARRRGEPARSSSD